MAEKKSEIWVYEFNNEAAYEFREQISERVTDNIKKPIIVYIDSYGGYIDSLMAMIETMDEAHAYGGKVITACMGKAMSCGAVLLSHGMKRFCGPHSRVMIHEVSSSSHGNINEVKTSVEESDRLNKRLGTLLAKNCGMKNYEQIKKIYQSKDKRDIYFTPEEALKFKLIDHIGYPQIIPSTSWNISCKTLGVKDAERSSKT